jgi:hypothetical protein
VWGSLLLRKKVARRLPVGRLSILAVLPILLSTPLYPESLLFSIDWKVPMLSQIDSDLFDTSPLTCRHSNCDPTFPLLLFPCQSDSAGCYCWGEGRV